MGEGRGGAGRSGAGGERGRGVVKRERVISREDPRGDRLFGRESMVCTAKVRSQGCVSMKGSKQTYNEEKQRQDLCHGYRKNLCAGKAPLKKQMLVKDAIH